VLRNIALSLVDVQFNDRFQHSIVATTRGLPIKSFKDSDVGINAEKINFSQRIINTVRDKIAMNLRA